MNDDSNSRPGTTAALFLLVVVVALGVRLVFLGEIVGTAHDEFQTMEMLDTHTFDAWARDIADGDWLGRTPPHPYHEWWQGPIAPPEKWIEWYGSEAVYHQGPLYPYVAALVYSVTDNGRRGMQIVQILLGAFHAGLVFLLARRFVGAIPSVVAGAMMALYAPMIMYETALLRDALLTHVSTLAVFACVMALDRRSWRWSLGAGAACGAAIATKPAAALFTVALAVLFGVRNRRLLGPFLGAVLVLLAPFAVRNLALGIAPLKLTTRGPVAFITGNAADGPGVGWNPPPSTAEILERSDYRLGKTIAETLKTHANEPLGFLRLQWTKLGAYFRGDEIGNNLQYYHMQRGSRILRTPPGVPHTLVAALGLAGAILAWRRYKPLAPLYILLVCHTAATVGFFVISRFRQPAVPTLIVFAAVLLSTLTVDIRRKSWTGTLLPVGLIAVFLVLAWPRLPERERYDSGVFAAEVLLSTRRNDIPAALETANAAAGIFDDHVPTLNLAGKVRQAAGRHREAGEVYARAFQLEPDNITACVGIGNTTDATGSSVEALEHLETCLELPGADADADLAYSLGVLYRRAGDSERAKAAFMRGLELRPGDYRAPLARRAIEEEGPPP
jgi:tetratricopeptide (TPR) repeat protein